jgi:CheY-like chemotaxis protein
MAAGKQRGNHEGSVYEEGARNGRPTGRWIAQVWIHGKKRRAVASTEAKAKQKLRKILNEVHWLRADEESLVKLAVSFLERLGYRVCGYTRADEALAAFRLQPDAFDLVVTDYNMPAMSGMDVALAVMSLRPAAIVALASGFLRPAEAEHARALGIRATIRKPFTIEDLGEVVQRLLHARHGQT